MLSRRLVGLAGRRFCSGVESGEARLQRLLRLRFPDAPRLDVTDISGGCGSMYDVHITSEAFKGLPLVRQHKIVTQALEKEIKNMHGIRIHTKVAT